MFAVPGWSVSAEKLKSEVPGLPSNGSPSAPKPKKRKRPGRTNENVTAANVADLWERVIEQKEAPKAQSEKKKPREEKNKQDKREKKRQRTESAQELSHSSESAKSLEEVHSSSKTEPKPQKKEKKDKKDKKTKKHHDESKAQDQSESQAAPAKAQQLVPTSKPTPLPAPKLTPLQASMREKLISARFRHLNETLYTRPSAEAYQLFQDSPEMFQEYHEGFRRQVGVWPENPVDSYIAEIRQRGRVKNPKDQHRRHHAPHHQPPKSGAQPLPRTDGTCVIADLGCGDARLASSLQADQRKLRLEILSFDLHSPAPFVTKADIANLPLSNGTVDLAIFCLALMGTNWVDFVEEAYRVLRWKGELWIAEIKSRFGPVGGAGGKRGPGKVVEHSVGNRKKAGVGGKKAKIGDDPEANEAELAVEVDGVEDKRQQTDVSAFLEALRKRGFILQGEAEEAVDLSNKMFVKMRFVKALSPVTGKGVAAAQAREAAFDGQRKVKKKKFIDDEADGDVNEAIILKPCVYKIR